MNPLTHIGFLDACATTEKMAPIKAATAEAAAAYHALLSQNKIGSMSEEERARETELLRYQIKEIEAAALQADEEDALMKERALL
ncbi:MAG: DNA repair protein RecN, partial [Eubacteriales bacterium]|nr:DNA repair protein RecN [Eubacteriales bacterium]